MIPPPTEPAPEPAGPGPDLDVVLEAGQRHDPAALRVLYEALAPQVTGYLRARGAREADDLTSEVFLTVFTRISTVTGGYAGLRSLLFSVAHARLVDAHRRRAYRGDALPYDPERDRRTSPSAEDTAQANLGAERAAALLESLPAAQRDVLALRVLADLSIEQTAQTLGLSQGAVKQLQRRALIALRNATGPTAVT